MLGPKKLALVIAARKAVATSRRWRLEGGGESNNDGAVGPVGDDEDEAETGPVEDGSMGDGVVIEEVREGSLDDVIDSADEEEVGSDASSILEPPGFPEREMDTSPA